MSQSDSTTGAPQPAHDRPDGRTPREPGSSSAPAVRTGETPSPGPIRFDQPTVISKGPPLAAPAAEAVSRGPEYGRALEGIQLDHFELQEFIGGGGMGAVYRALDTRLNRIVAIKILASEQAADDETVRRFQNEAQSAARLDHENIARAYYVGEAQGLHYIAFEYIEGVNLRDLVEQRGQLSLAEVVSYTLQIADALAHASARDVVHRDIKPSNVLVTADGRAKLVDMGLARFHKPAESRDDLTASGVTLGTFDYISPEQARDPKKADVRSDIYSLGCTLYFMLTGRPPFPEGTVLQKLLQHQGDAPPDPRELNADVPPELVRILSRMLAKDPARRYQQPQELVADLARLAHDLDLPAVATSYHVAPAEQTWRFRLDQHLPWMVPAALLAIVVAAVYFLPITTAPPQERGSDGHAALPAGDEPNGPAAIPSGLPDAPIEDSDDLLPGRTLDPTSDEPSPDEQPRDDRDTTATTSTDQPRSPDASETVEQSPGPMPLPRWNGASAGVEPLAGSLDASSLSGALAPRPLEADASVATSSAVDANRGGAPSASDAPSAAAPNGSGVDSLPAPTNSSTVRAPALLVVGDDADGATRRFDSLAEACAAATSGDIVELRYDGRRVEEPFGLNNLRLTIRAGEGFQPVVTFAPDEVDPLKYPRGMIAVNGRQLTLYGVSLELNLPRMAPADAWCLIKIQQAELLRLERCSLTVRNAADPATAYHAGVSFIEIGPPNLGGSMLIAPGEGVDLPIGIRLINCIARGEATFLRVDAPRALDVAWDNGLLATTERFLALGGSPDAPPTGVRVDVELRHLTAAMHKGLCLMTATKDAPHVVPTSIDCTDCILLAAADAALLDQIGVAPISVERDQLTWKDEGTFYEGFSIFRRIQGMNQQGLPQQTTDPTWRAFWDRVGWKDLPSSDRAIHTHQPQDYRLDGGAISTPAARGATDGRDAGFDAAQLPPLPPDSQRPSSSDSSGAASSSGS